MYMYMMYKVPVDVHMGHSISLQQKFRNDPLRF